MFSLSILIDYVRANPALSQAELIAHFRAQVEKVDEPVRSILVETIGFIEYGAIFNNIWWTSVERVPCYVCNTGIARSLVMETDWVGYLEGTQEYWFCPTCQQMLNVTAKVS